MYIYIHTHTYIYIYIKPHGRSGGPSCVSVNKRNLYFRHEVWTSQAQAAEPKHDLLRKQRCFPNMKYKSEPKET